MAQGGSDVFWSAGPEEILAGLQASASGLAQAVAAARLEEFGPNLAVEAPRRRILAKIGRRLVEPLVAILIVAALVSGATGDWASLVVILVILAVSIALERQGVEVLRVGATSADLVGDFKTLMPAAIAQMRRRDPDLSKSVFWIVGATEVFSEIHAIDGLAGGVPVLGAVPDVVTAGRDSAALAIGVSFEDNAHLAGLYAARILKGTARAGDLPVGVVQPPDIAISFLKARQCHLQIPFDFFESASRVVDAQGRLVREDNRPVSQPKP